MAANIVKLGQYIAVRTTGLVTSTSIKIQSIHFVAPTTTLTSTSLVQRTGQTILFRSRQGAGVPAVVMFPKGVTAIGGLSCTTLGVGAEAWIYLE